MYGKENISWSNAHTMLSYIEDYILFLCAIEKHMNCGLLGVYT